MTIATQDSAQNQLAKLQEDQITQIIGLKTQVEQLHMTLNTLKTTVSSGFGQVRITDIDIPFGAMVKLLVKYVLAAIPALFIAVIVFSIITAIFGGIIGGLLR